MPSAEKRVSFFPAACEAVKNEDGEATSGTESLLCRLPEARKSHRKDHCMLPWVYLFIFVLPLNYDAVGERHLLSSAPRYLRSWGRECGSLPCYCSPRGHPPLWIKHVGYCCSPEVKIPQIKLKL